MNAIPTGTSAAIMSPVIHFLPLLNQSTANIALIARQGPARVRAQRGETAKHHAGAEPHGSRRFVA